MLAVLLISIIANAFIILSCSPSNFYKLHRYNGQLLYIKAIFIGLISTLFAFLTDAFIKVVKYIGNLIPPEESWKLDGNTKQVKEILIFFFLTLIISFLYCLLERVALRIVGWIRFGFKDEKSYQKAKIFLMYIILNDSPLDKLLFSSYIERRRPVEKCVQ